MDRRNCEAHTMSADVAADLARNLDGFPEFVATMHRRAFAAGNFEYAQRKAREWKQPAAVWVDSSSQYAPTQIQRASWPLYPYLGEFPVVTVLPCVGYVRGR